MRYQIQWTSRFKKDYKQAIRRGLPIEELDDVIRLLAAGEALPRTLKDYALTGNWLGHRECHIRPDWLLIYKISSNQIALSLTRTGTHSDLLQ